ncbi:tripartite tricarboxylate transporter TctB family protein [Natranaerobius thermophilus]|uniref:DUF1468 domain-containing protein n=1 Tax=Natranaerobius thermophilus (strain ATCC BAA-1301 / DSM 18059 / JW/NM-WN-LF) TaxID=457570 RepID=B2A6J6_NATTJ|nr:tripartite tricarboxylate transporter TctB family protein [Natranaerobius thermophilus]ACB85529.1 hypothetical protein Nther_1959 [Natranaerobius thermophilus JW/NM-WN-LF]
MRSRGIQYYKLELLLCGLALVIAGLLIMEALKYPVEAYIFPVAVLSIGIVASIGQGAIVTWKVLKNKFEEHDLQSPMEEIPLIKMLIIIVVFLAYLFLIPRIGFFVMTWIFLNFLLILFQKSPIYVNLALGTSLTVAMYLLFSLFLRVPLPRGLFI